jgi:uncharacterized RDD family membrane protein YckC
MRADSSDPRSIITAEAFEIDPRLLGTPLARPSRRLWAIAIDFALVAVLTAVLSDVQLLIWGGIAVLLVYLALKRSPRVRAQAAGVLMRASLGCLGIVIAGGVLIALGASRMGKSERRQALDNVIEKSAALAPADVRREIADADYGDARTPEDALRVMERAAAELGDVPAGIRTSVLKASVPRDAPWASQADSLIALAVAATGAGRGAAAARGPAFDSAAAAVAKMSDGEVLDALAADPKRRGRGDARHEALRARAAAIVAADTLASLDRQAKRLTAQLDDEKRAHRQADSLAAASKTGASVFASLMRDIWKQLGSAFGLWSVYFTVLTSLWQGQTIGKRLMRVRVLRLDGEPMGWWSAFERAGGYVAGVATGLMGFAQVLWDPNRQCIHDKIVGTVVVVDGAQRVEGAWHKRPTP